MAGAKRDERRRSEFAARKAAFCGGENQNQR